MPLLSPSLSSRWLSLVTDVDVATGRALIDSMSNEVIVRDDSIRSVVPFEPMDYDSAVLAALGERAKERQDETVVVSRESSRRQAPSGHRRGRVPWRRTRTLPEAGCGCDTATRHRRRLVAAVALAGTGLLGASLSTEPDSTEFYCPHLRRRWHLVGRRAGLGNRLLSARPGGRGVTSAGT